MVQLLAEKYLQ